MLIGMGAGIGVCVGPVFIGEIAPLRIKGSTGVLFQLSIVFGILSTQALGLAFATPSRWRLVLLISTLLSGLQILFGTSMVESPAWLTANGRSQEAETVRTRLWVGSSGYESVSDVSPPPYGMLAATYDSSCKLEYL